MMSTKTVNPDIVISISKGILEIKKRPSGISILVKDYDIQDENADTQKDEHGSYQPYYYDRR